MYTLKSAASINLIICVLLTSVCRLVCGSINKANSSPVSFAYLYKSVQPLSVYVPCAIYLISRKAVIAPDEALTFPIGTFITSLTPAFFMNIFLASAG